MTDARRARDAFTAAASEFCELYESAAQLGAERFLQSLARALPRLQAAAVELSLPDDDELPEDDLDVRLTQEEVEQVDWPVLEVLKELDWSAVREHLHEATVGCASPAADPVFLYDDLSGVYHDLEEGLRLLEAGRPEGEAVFAWRHGFQSHWGYHNAEALRVVHYYVALHL